MKNTVLMFCVLPISDSAKLLNFFFWIVLSPRTLSGFMKVLFNGYLFNQNLYLLSWMIRDESNDE